MSAEDQKFATQEEAIAAAMAESERGDTIAIHDASCAIDDEGDGCDCEPVIIRVEGAEA